MQQLVWRNLPCSDCCMVTPGATHMPCHTSCCNMCVIRHKEARSCCSGKPLQSTCCQLPLYSLVPRYNIWLLIELMPKGVVFSFVFFSCSLVLTGLAIIRPHPEDYLEATAASTTFVWFSGPLQQTDFNSTHVEQNKPQHFPFPIWRDEAMHELLMHMARSGAEIIKQARNSSQPPGNVMRSMIRVDVVLTQQAGQVSAVILEVAVA